MVWLYRLISRWPLALLHRLGAALGWLTYALSPSYRRRFKDQVAQAGVPWSEARPAIASAGRMLAELPWLWEGQRGKSLDDWLTWDGAELIAAGLARGRGVIVATPHMGCFEICAQGIAERFTTPESPMTVLYRPARHAAVREIMAGSRERPGLATAPASIAGVRLMLRALRRGEIIGVLPDQVPPEGLGVWAPFFGRPAYTPTLTARLVQQTGATLLLIWGERLAGGRG